MPEKLGEGLKFKYEPIWPQAEIDMKFHYYEKIGEDKIDEETGEIISRAEEVLKIREDILKNLKLVKSIDELKSFLPLAKDKIIGFDTETTGLSYGEDKIVGFSLSLDEWSGIYVPIRHQEKLETVTEVPKLDKDGHPVILKSGRASMKKEKTYTLKESDENLNPKEALDVLYEILLSAKRVLMHNSEFDLNMLKFEGYDVNRIKSFDTLILPYLFDPEATGLAGLKALEKRVLGRVVPEFKDVLGKSSENFALVAPKDGYVYACHDDKTEVLTEYGWVKWAHYDGKTRLATVNLDNNKVEYQSPIRTYAYEYNGVMECCKSQSIDYCVTPNHNMVVAEGQCKKKNFKWLLKRVDELNVEEVALTAGHTSCNQDKIILNGKKYNLIDLAPLAALVLADGYCRSRENRTGYSINICTNVHKNFNEIVGIINQSGLKWNSYKRGEKVIYWECSNKDIWEWLFPYSGHGALNKRVPKEILSASEDVVKSFLRAYSITDGHNYSSGATQYYTISKGMVDDLQTLLLLSGKRSSVYTRKPKDKVIEGRFINSENCHTIYSIKTTGSKTTRYKKRNRFQINYSGMVYCAEVPNHTLITRRNGSTLVSGNCCDTMGVVGIFNKMFPVVKELLSRFKGNLDFDGVHYNVLSKDNQMVQMFVDYYGHAKILIDRQKAIKFKEQLEAEQKQVIKDIYTYFDKGMFNLSASSKEFKNVMYSKNVVTGVKTDKGGDSWSKSALEEMRRNIAKLKDCITKWKTIKYDDGLLDKGGLGFQLAQLLIMYGKGFFLFGKETVNSLPVFTSKRIHPDLVTFWRTIKAIYQAEEGKYNILMKIQRNNSLNKALSSYVDKLTQVDECIMRYRLKGTKSGRLSSGNGSKTDKKRSTYYIDLNAQNLTKPASAYYSATQTSLDDPEAILGWRFKSVEKEYAIAHLEDEYIVEGQDPGITIRGCLKAPEGRYVVSMDYDAEEYLLICLLSGDSKMYENFMNGIDPHTASAYAIWGEENYDKAKRKKAKQFNFLNNYSGGAVTLAQNLDIPVDEAQDMINKYNQTFHEMVEWKLQQIEKMYQNDGVVFNNFGRPRQFKGWINTIRKNSENYDNWFEKQELEKAGNRVKSAVERRVVSHIIQGTAGDILRLVLYKLYLRYFKNRDPHIDFMSTVHDEVNYTIDKEVTIEYVRELEKIMTFDCFDKRLPIKTSTDIGFTYGNMFPFVWEDEKTKQVLIPKRVHHA